MKRRRNIILGIIGLGIVGFIVLQIFPIGSIIPDFAPPGNPPVTYTVNWDSADTEKLAKAACFDCHSNETSYPWYSSIAPVSWLVNHDINEGRRKMNFSTNTHLFSDEMETQIEKGEMPKWFYLPLHPEANLTPEQKQQLIDGLIATFGEVDFNG
ncbi:MAG: cytochrome C [Anaerolineaceae bacterium]|nr:cytochrome C [Anaerolineaceae bacterium]